VKTPIRWAFALPLASVFLPMHSAAEEPPCPFYESRSGLCGYYHSQISPAEAFVHTVVKRGSWSNPQRRPVILDVRSLAEYEAGHPEHAVNVPYPYIQQTCDSQGRTSDGACLRSVGTVPQTNGDFVAYVQSIIRDKDTPIYTLCRTGVRSVGAGNLLTDAGYTNVRNIWEGFVGINLTAPKVQADGSVKVLPVDLNHDGMLDDRDKSGWRYHQALPYETRLLPNLIYKPMASMYGSD
jgi:rhodanese-related sulfurtransferase